MNYPFLAGNFKGIWRMKKKLLTVLILFISLILFDRLFAYLIFECNHYFFKDNSFEERLTSHLQEHDYNALILGSSRTYEGIHPSLIKNEKLHPFKWSYSGFGPKYNYYFYNLYKKIKGKPKVVIFGIDYFIYTLFSSPSALAELNIEEAVQFKQNYLDPSILLLKNKKKLDIVLKEITGSFRPEVNSPVRDIEKIQFYCGSGKSDLKDHKVFKRKTRFFKGVAFTKPPGSEGEYFLRMLDELRDDKVDIILVAIPDYIGTFRTNRFQVVFRKHMKKLRNMYENIKLLNYNYMQKFSLADDSLFLDGGFGFTNSHLSNDGAAIFNKMLRSDLIRLGY